MAAILYRYAIYKGYYTANQSNLSAQFYDYSQISSYAVVPMSWAHANGYHFRYDADNVESYG